MLMIPLQPTIYKIYAYIFTTKILTNLLKDNRIEIVYLNSDTDLDEEKWLDFIIDHNLVSRVLPYLL